MSELRDRLAREFASAFIRIRGAHHPDPGEPCAWCRLAAEQAAEAVVTSESIREALAAQPESAGLDVDVLGKALIALDDSDPNVLSQIAIDDTAALGVASLLAAVYTRLTADKP